MLTEINSKVFDFSFFELINDPVFVIDGQGVWVYCNQAFELFCGLSNNVIKLQIPAIRHFLRSSDAQRATESNANFFTNNLQEQEANISSNGQSKSMVIKVSKYILRNKQGCTDGFIGIIRKVDQPFEHYPDHEKSSRPQFVAHICAKTNSASLTPKELESLYLMAFGYSVKKIAILLKRSAHTIMDHRKSIYLKLNVHSCTEAVREARIKGLLKD